MCVDGDMLVSVSLDGDIRVWNSQPRGRRCLRTIVRRSVHMHVHVHVPLWHPYLVSQAYNTVLLQQYIFLP